MRNLLDVTQTLESVHVDREMTAKGPPSFEDVMQEIGTIILGYLLLGLAADLLTRILSQG